MSSPDRPIYAPPFSEMGGEASPFAPYIARKEAHDVRLREAITEHTDQRRLWRRFGPRRSLRQGEARITVSGTELEDIITDMLADSVIQNGLRVAFLEQVAIPKIEHGQINGSPPRFVIDSYVGSLRTLLNRTAEEDEREQARRTASAGGYVLFSESGIPRGDFSGVDARYKKLLLAVGRYGDARLLAQTGSTSEGARQLLRDREALSVTAVEEDESLWESITREPQLRAFFGEETVRGVEEERAIRRFFTEPRSGSVSVSEALLEFPSAKVVPYALLGFWRRGHAFTSAAEVERRQTAVVQFLTQLPEAEVTALQASGAPGITEIVAEIRSHPEAPLTTEAIEGHVITFATQLLTEHSGDRDKTKVALEALINIRVPLDDACCSAIVATLAVDGQNTVSGNAAIVSSLLEDSPK